MSSSEKIELDYFQDAFSGLTGMFKWLSYVYAEWT